MDTFRPLPRILVLALLVAWPAMAGNDRPGDSGTPGTERTQPPQWTVLELGRGSSGRWIALEGPAGILPAGLELFWTDGERDEWVPVPAFRVQGNLLLFQAPPHAPGRVDFLVRAEAGPWGGASCTRVPGNPQGAPEDPGSLATEEDVLAALALIQDPDGETSPREEDPDGETSPTEEDPEPAEGTPGPALLAEGFPEAAVHFRQILEQQDLRVLDLVPVGPGSRTLIRNLYRVIQTNNHSTTLSYAMAVECAQGLNRLNQSRRWREAPFTADELFLGGRPPSTLAGPELLHFIMQKARFLAPVNPSPQGTLDTDWIRLRIRGLVPITPKFVARLRERLNLPALGLTLEDLDRLPSPANSHFADHPSNLRAQALFTKALGAPGSRGKTHLMERIGLNPPQWWQVKRGSCRVPLIMARKLSAFHNREFPGEPPTTPEYFLGK